MAHRLCIAAYKEDAVIKYLPMDKFNTKYFLVIA
jgi:hypothetical protein